MTMFLSFLAVVLGGFALGRFSTLIFPLEKKNSNEPPRDIVLFQEIIQDSIDQLTAMIDVYGQTPKDDPFKKELPPLFDQVFACAHRAATTLEIILSKERSQSSARRRDILISQMRALKRCKDTFDDIRE